MKNLHPHQAHLINCIRLEHQEERKRYNMDDVSTIKYLKEKGYLIDSIHIVRKTFGLADYPEIHFKIPPHIETFHFKENVSVHMFIDRESVIKGVFLGWNDRVGSVRLFSSDFPDWIDEKGVGVKLSPDEKQVQRFVDVVENISTSPKLYETFLQIHDDKTTHEYSQKETSQINLQWKNAQLNESQQEAVISLVQNEELHILHGPPGTGKTTTIIESVLHLIDNKKKVLLSAPSNAAADHLAKSLLPYTESFLRVGNNVKIDADIIKHTPEGKFAHSKESKELKKLKIKAEELRKLSYQYKRNFGKEERAQRNLIIQQVKALRSEIKMLQKYYNAKLVEEAKVIIGTPVGLSNFLTTENEFDAAILDEAGQCLEPLSWMIFSHAKSWVLAGDPFQLPPTVLSDDAIKKGYNKSLLELSFKSSCAQSFLDTQYRMPAEIIGFSNAYFYENKLKSIKVNQVENPVVFYDTAGTGFEEKVGEDGKSLVNEGELSIVQSFLEQSQTPLDEVVFISPYSAQVKAFENLHPSVKSSTIDSFQGQEKEVVIISLVRSNTDGNIGFLKDYRRLNVAMTRAKKQLVLIGDSATISSDSFYEQLLNYMESKGTYRSAWELM